MKFSRNNCGSEIQPYAIPYDKLERELKKAQTANFDLRKVNEKLLEDYKEIKVQFSNKKDELQDVKDANVSLKLEQQQEINRFMGTVNKLHRQNEKLLESVRERQQELDDSRSENIKLKEQISSLNGDDQRINELVNKIKQLKCSSRKKERKLENKWKSERENWNIEISSLKKKLQNCLSEIETLKSIICEKDNTIEDYNDHIGVLTQERDDYETQVSFPEKKLEHPQKKHASPKASIQMLVAPLRHLEPTLDEDTSRLMTRKDGRLKEQEEIIKQLESFKLSIQKSLENFDEAKTKRIEEFEEEREKLLKWVKKMKCMAKIGETSSGNQLKDQHAGIMKRFLKVKEVYEELRDEDDPSTSNSSLLPKNTNLLDESPSTSSPPQMHASKSASSSNSYNYNGYCPPPQPPITIPRSSTSSQFSKYKAGGDQLYHELELISDVIPSLPPLMPLPIGPLQEPLPPTSRKTRRKTNHKLPNTVLNTPTFKRQRHGENIRKRIRGSKYYCFCGFCCTNKLQLISHILKITQLRNFECIACPRCFHYFGHVKRHLREVHELPDALNNFVGGCRSCGQFFKARVERRKHICPNKDA